MAKIVITIEDSPDGKVKIVSNPTAAHCAYEVNTYRENAKGSYKFALTALKAIVDINKESKGKQKKTVIWTPT